MVNAGLRGPEIPVEKLAFMQLQYRRLIRCLRGSCFVLPEISEFTNGDLFFSLDEPRSMRVATGERGCGLRSFILQSDRTLDQKLPRPTNR